MRQTWLHMRIVWCTLLMGKLQKMSRTRIPRLLLRATSTLLSPLNVIQCVHAGATFNTTQSAAFVSHYPWHCHRCRCSDHDGYVRQRHYSGDQDSNLESWH